MSQIQIGDVVDISNDAYEPILFLSRHWESSTMIRGDLKDTTFSFIELKTAFYKIVLTKSHRVKTARGFVSAGSVRAGLDSVYTATGKQDLVLSTKLVQDQGVYFPVTRSGTIVVDGIVASCFSDETFASAPHLLIDIALNALSVLQRTLPSETYARIAASIDYWVIGKVFDRAALGGDKNSKYFFFNAMPAVVLSK